MSDEHRNDGQPWTATDLSDLRHAVKRGCTIQQAAEFLHRAGMVEEVAAKAAEIGLLVLR